MAKANIAEFLLVERWFQSEVMQKEGIASRVSVGRNKDETPLYQSFKEFCEGLEYEVIPVRRFISILEIYILQQKVESEKKRDFMGTVFTNIGLKKDKNTLIIKERKKVTENKNSVVEECVPANTMR
jgi:hypothetical protein